MHSAPSVIYPVGRSRLAGRFLLGVWLLGVLSFSTWCLQAGSAPWKSALLALAVSAAAAGAVCAGRLGAGARLRWDGRHWHVERASIALLQDATAVVHLDLQSLVLVRLKADDRAAHWVWAERSTDSVHWPSFRRALHARVAGRPPHATASPLGS